MTIVVSHDYFHLVVMGGSFILSFTISGYDVEKLQRKIRQNPFLTCIGCDECDPKPQDDDWLYSDPCCEPCESCERALWGYGWYVSTQRNWIKHGDCLRYKLGPTRRPPFMLNDEDDAFRQFADFIEKPYRYSPYYEFDAFELQVVWLYCENPPEFISAYATGKGFVHHDCPMDIPLCEDDDSDDTDDDTDDDNTEEAGDIPEEVDWALCAFQETLWDDSRYQKQWNYYAQMKQLEYLAEVRSILDTLLPDNMVMCIQAFLQ